MPTTVILVNGQHDNHIYIYTYCVSSYIYYILSYYVYIYIYIYCVYGFDAQHGATKFPGWYLSRGLESSDPSTGIMVGSTGRLGVYPQNSPKE